MREIEYLDVHDVKGCSFKEIQDFVNDGWDLDNGDNMQDLLEYLNKDGKLPDDFDEFRLEKIFVGLESEVNYSSVSVEDSAKIIEYLSKDSSNILFINSKGKYVVMHSVDLLSPQKASKILDSILDDGGVIEYLSKSVPNYKELLAKVVGKGFGVKTYISSAILIDLLIDPKNLLFGTYTWDKTVFSLEKEGTKGVFFALRILNGKMELIGCSAYDSALLGE